MKITVYTISDCKFSKEEKDFLNAHKLPFEEKNLEANKEFLTEMLSVSNNFAGTPVTKIEKDDGQIMVLKGFTQKDFEEALGLAPVAAPSVTEPVKTPVPPPIAPVPPPAAPPPAAPVPPQVEKPEEKPLPPEPKIEPPPSPKVEEPKADDPLKSILDDLENKAVTPPVPPVVANAAAGPAPTIPNFEDKT